MRFTITCVRSAGCGPAYEMPPVASDSMGEALRVWIQQDGWASLKRRPLTDSHREYPTGQGSIIHPAAAGRFYAGGVRLDGPAEVTREEWLEAIEHAVAEAEENHRRNPPKLPEYPMRRKYRPRWWEDDFAGKHGPEL